MVKPGIIAFNNENYASPSTSHIFYLSTVILEENVVYIVASKSLSIFDGVLLKDFLNYHLKFYILILFIDFPSDISAIISSHAVSVYLNSVSSPLIFAYLINLCHILHLLGIYEPSERNERWWLTIGKRTPFYYYGFLPRTICKNKVFSEFLIKTYWYHYIPNLILY